MHTSRALRARSAESTGVEPVSPYGHQFSRLTHYRPAHSPTRVLYLIYNEFMKKTTLEEVSAGGVVFRRNDQGKIEFLLGKHSGYHKWVLPKGLVERGESLTEAALREVTEEVGIVANVVDLTPIKTIEYYYYADLEEKLGKDATGKESERRIGKYQEEGGIKTRIHKQVIFYLMEMEKDLGGAGWEMEDRKWVEFNEGIKLLAFETEREVFKVGKKLLL